MRVVLFNKQEKAGGGIGIFTKRFKKFLLDQGHEIFELRYSKESGGKEFISIPYLLDKQAYVFLPSPNTEKLVMQHLKKISPDIVYFPIGASTFDFLIPKICKRLNIKTFGVFHADISRTNRFISSLTSLPFRIYLPLCKRVDKIQIFSSGLKRFLVSKGVSSNKIVVIPNGVDTNIYKPGKTHFKSKIKMEKGVLFLGRLMWEKHPEILVKAFLKVREPGAKLIMAGSGDLEKKLKRKFKEDDVIFLGQVKDEVEKIDILRACDIFVLPSSYEGMSLSLLEAMACGLCCITSDAASQKQMLKGAGIVIPFDELGDRLPRALKKCFGDKKYREKLGKAARKRAIEKYSQDIVFAKIEKQFATM